MVYTLLTLLQFPAIAGLIFPLLLGFVKREKLRGKFVKFYSFTFAIWLIAVVIPFCINALQEAILNNCIKFHKETNLECSQWELILLEVPGTSGVILWLLSLYIISYWVYKGVTKQSS
jgi:hypothetical protein